MCPHMSFYLYSSHSRFSPNKLNSGLHTHTHTSRWSDNPVVRLHHFWLQGYLNWQTTQSSIVRRPVQHTLHPCEMLRKCRKALWNGLPGSCQCRPKAQAGLRHQQKEQIWSMLSSKDAEWDEGGGRAGVMGQRVGVNWGGQIGAGWEHDKG